MARFQIYIPTDISNAAEAEAFAVVGLPADLARGVDCHPCHCGPDGKPGRLFTWLDPLKVRIGFQPDKQTWIKNAAGYWVGVWNDDPPNESDLRRPDSRKGAFVELANGERWLITTPKTLDRFPYLDPETGSVKWIVDEKFNWLVQDLEKRMAAGVVQSGDGEDGKVKIIFDDETDLAFFFRLLAINYRITPDIICYLRLLSRDTIREMVAALMGLTLEVDQS